MVINFIKLYFFAMRTFCDLFQILNKLEFLGTQLTTLASNVAHIQLQLDTDKEQAGPERMALADHIICRRPLETEAELQEFNGMLSSKKFAREMVRDKYCFLLNFIISSITCHFQIA